MDNLLSFDKPKKVRPTDKHNEMYLSDSDIAGTYVSNMSHEDMERWKGKHIKGKDERIEIRKNIRGVSLLMVVYKKRNGGKNLKRWYDKHQDIQLSMNGKLNMTYDDFFDLEQVVRESIEILL